MPDVSLSVYKPADRKFFYVQWRDPVTGKKKTRSTGKKTRREADRVAGEIALQLKEDRLSDSMRITWADFRQRYEDEVSDSQADNTAALDTTTFNAIERLIDPKFLKALDASQISRFQQLLRKESKSEATIKSYLTHLKAALRWAGRMKMLREVPEVVMPKRVTTMKGRPITTEEFERLLAKTPEIVGEKAAASWKHLLTGLWWSGLRLGEALELQWDADAAFAVDFSHRRPMFRICATAEKGKKNRLLPMAPEFAEFLQAVPNDEWSGYVFSPLPKRDHGNRPRLDTTSSIIVEIGKASGVKVSERQSGKRKFASAHDLRRSFGFRWAMRVMPPVLMQMMRHENIQTTQQFYVGRNAEMAAEAIWDSLYKMSIQTSPEVNVHERKLET